VKPSKKNSGSSLNAPMKWELVDPDEPKGMTKTEIAEYLAKPVASPRLVANDEEAQGE
jgi:hypothetical protein